MKIVLKKENGTMWIALWAMLVLLCVFFKTPVKADDLNSLGIICASNFNSSAIYPCADNKWVIGFEKMTEKSKNVKITSSNKSLARIRRKHDYIEITFKKPGKTRLTVEFKTGKKKYVYRGTVEAAKFVNPFKTLKVNGKSYLSKVRKQGVWIDIKSKKDTVKFLYELKPGWKVSMAPTMEYEQEGSVKTLKKVKDGKTVKAKLPPEDVEIDFFVHSNKLGIGERVFVSIHR